MPGAFVTSADACDREAAWLALPGSSDDQLPSLLTVDGGPWDIVQAYQRRTPPTRTSAVFVARSDIHLERFGHQRSIFGYNFVLKLWWPMSSSQGSAEGDQRAFDVAVHALCMRIRGIAPNTPHGMDKTHNGAFMQVAEGSNVTATMPGVHVHFEDAEETLNGGSWFRATAMYMADDRDFND